MLINNVVCRFFPMKNITEWKGTLCYLPNPKVKKQNANVKSNWIRFDYSRKYLHILHKIKNGSQSQWLIAHLQCCNFANVVILMLMFSMQILFFKQAPQLFRVIYSRLSILDFVLNIISTLKTVQKALIRQDNGLRKQKKVHGVLVRCIWQC